MAHNPVAQRNSSGSAITPATVGILAGLDEIDGLGKTGIHRRLFRPIIPARSDFVYARLCYNRRASMRTALVVLFFALVVVAGCRSSSSA